MPFVFHQLLQPVTMDAVNGGRTMRIIIDIDGTITDFESFVFAHATRFVYKKVGLMPVNLFGYDVDQVFDLANQFVRLGKNRDEAECLSQTIMNQFWNKHYLKYCFATPLRNGARETINALYDMGHEIVICSSRNRSCEPGWIGKVVRWTTKLQLKMNGLKTTQILLFPDDHAKANAIKLIQPDVVLEDKPELVLKFSKFTHVVCINTSYNYNLEWLPTIYRADGIESGEIFNHLLQWQLRERADHGEKKANKDHSYPIAKEEISH